jgi:hypothetical protein
MIHLAQIQTSLLFCAVLYLILQILHNTSAKQARAKRSSFLIQSILAALVLFVIKLVSSEGYRFVLF